MNPLTMLNILLLCSLLFFTRARSANEDTEFAEFEEFEDDEYESAPKASKATADVDRKGSGSGAGEKAKTPEEAPAGGDDDEDAADVTVEEEDEFAHFADDDEFEGIEKDEIARASKDKDKPKELKIEKVPISFRNNWDAFYIELLLVFGMLVYVANFIWGRSKNSRIAQDWYSINKDILQQNFSIVGDDGSGDSAQSGVLMKEADHAYLLWSTGRVAVEGALVQLNLFKRQDLISVISAIFKPVYDQVVFKVTMDAADMDSYVFAVAHKKTAAKLGKDYPDISLYCQEKKASDKFGVPGSYTVLSEIGEATAGVLDGKIQAVLAKCEGVVDYLHFSDQYVGVKAADDSDQSKVQEPKKTLVFCFNVGRKGTVTRQDLDDTRELTQLVFYCIDKVRRFRLSKEGKAKADKSRQRAQETQGKLAHQQRQEAAQQRREDKVRAEKERYLNEDDPEKARKLEDKLNQREQRKKMQKMGKMVKIKAG